MKNCDNCDSKDPEVIQCDICEAEGCNACFYDIQHEKKPNDFRVCCGSEECDLEVLAWSQSNE